MTNSYNIGGNSCWDFATGATIASAANQTFTVGDGITAISTITITDLLSPTITDASDLRIAIATSTTFMLWDTTDLGAEMTGSAFDTGKVANPVAYEGGGSVLRITVSDDFDPGETLVVSALSFTSFATATAPLSGLKLFLGGAADQTGDSTDSKTITIKGTVAGVEHAGGQVTNDIDTSETSVSGAVLYGFNLTLAGGENMSVTNLVFNLSGVNGIAAGDITNAKLYVDYNGNKTVDGGDTQMGDAGTAAVSGQTGTITFSSDFTATTTRDYLLVADLASIGFGDQVTIALTPNNVTSSGVTSLLATTPASLTALSAVQHVKFPRGGGVIGFAAPAGQSIAIGGGPGAGAEDQEIGSSPGFFPPTTSGGTFDEWTTPDYAFASDGADATAASSWFREDYGGFGFSVPGSNTVNGIQVKLELSSTNPAGGTISVALSWNGGTGTTTTIETSTTLTESDTVVTLGGPSSTWGRTWTPAEFSDANFKVRLIAEPSLNTVNVDAIQVKVHHVAGGGGPGGGGEVLAPYFRNLAGVYKAGQNLILASDTFVAFIAEKLSAALSLF
ncbi:MAG: hypothetical protein A2942_02200 [Candidatus Lloydbacteria bacterium RIFCSPLOWO2_01_FULL_50_20]|uniref:Uncharacterized protein n=1 Tax=Candidatus Lloydbacteria bacterium RIFCSPLOWO2_01_FULL_50_20 TaxID=1798665 RepID=A0A1G2DK25_9BACT|nr:MAG: hypothetical protein A2942_02200 [Candidatus Lloydbacteria bacterium RIFCSPLOWO2_01_FULL_50_20]